MKPGMMLLGGSLCSLALVLLAGCGDSRGAENTASVSGTVKFEGKPLEAGEIHLYNQKRGIGPSAKIANGSFSFPAQIPPGTYEVAILPPQPEGEIDPEATPPDYPSIPQKYRSGTTSELKADIKDGNNSLEYDMGS